MATPVKTHAHWEQSQSAWIAPGKKLEIPVPMCKQGRLLAVAFDVCHHPMPLQGSGFNYLAIVLKEVAEFQAATPRAAVCRSQVISGLDVDFDIMLEGEDGNVIRLYGPTRRARGVHTVIEIPFDGEAFITFDNIMSWFMHKNVSYTLAFITSADAEVGPWFCVTSVALFSPCYHCHGSVSHFGRSKALPSCVSAGRWCRSPRACR